MSTSKTKPPASPERLYIPGEPGVWILVMGDLFVFALLFGTVAYYRLDSPAIFHASQPSLNQALGLANTFVLLTSSLFVVLGLDHARAAAWQAARRWAGAAFLLGLTFVVIKVIEYHQKIGEGLLPTTNIFYTMYFVLTGMHLIHVVAGLIALHLMRKGITAAATAEHFRLLECAAIFWHMVDVLWVILFALFYLHR